MSSEDIMKLFEEVASVYQNEGSEALTEERISELCKKHDISATELEDLFKDVPCSGEEKISIDDDILENVAGGKMDLKRGAATLLAALSAAGLLSSNASASEPKNVPDTVSRVQNRFGISKKTAKWMVGAAALLSAYPIAKAVKGLDSNKFKNWLKKRGAIRLDDSECDSLKKLIYRLRTCDKGKYKAEQYRNMFLVCPYDEDEKCKMFCACIGSSSSDTLQLASSLGFQCVCRGGLLTGSERFINGNLRQLLTIAQTPVIIVNRKVIDEIIISPYQYIRYENKIKYFGDDGEGMFDCAPGILEAFNSNGSDQPNGRSSVSNINSQLGTQDNAISQQPNVHSKSPSAPNSELPSTPQSESDPLAEGLDCDEFKNWLKKGGAIILDDSNCNSLEELKSRLSTCKKGKYKAKQYHNMLLVCLDKADSEYRMCFRACISDDEKSVKKLNNIFIKNPNCSAYFYFEKEFMQNQKIAELLAEGTVPVIVVNENVMRDIICPLCDMKYRGDDGKGMFTCAPGILEAFNINVGSGSAQR